MWDAFFEHLRRCGRSGNLFVVIFVSSGMAVSFGTVGLAILLGVFGAYLLWVCVEVRQQHERFEKLGQQPPLASVDLRVARVRLANSKTQRLRAEQARRLKAPSLARPAPGGSSPTLRMRLL